VRYRRQKLLQSGSWLMPALPSVAIAFCSLTAHNEKKAIQKTVTRLQNGQTEIAC
jgi:hypothetical protein